MTATREEAAKEYALGRCGASGLKSQPSLNEFIPHYMADAHLAGQKVGEARVREIVEVALEAFKHQTETHSGDYLPQHAQSLYSALAKLKELDT